MSTFVLNGVLKRMGYSAVPVLLGAATAYFAVRDAAFCSSMPLACGLPPSGAGLFLFMVSGFVLFRACVDLTVLGFGLARSTELLSDDLRSRLIVAILHTVLAAIILLFYLFFIGLQVA